MSSQLEDAFNEAVERRALGMEARIAALDDLVQRAWSLIAGAMSGNPHKPTANSEWMDAAHAWEIDYCMGQGSAGGGGVVSVLDPETGIEEPVTTGRIPDAEFVEPPLMPPAASPDERLREALALIAQHARLDLTERGIAEAERYAVIAEDALAAADREAPDEGTKR